MTVADTKEPSKHGNPTKGHIIAFLSLGFVVGNVVGMSASPIANTLVGLLFAFAGGSAVAFLRKLDETSRLQACQMITAASIGCLAGLYAGILVCEHRLLSPRSQSTTNGPSLPTPPPGPLPTGDNPNAAPGTHHGQVYEQPVASKEYLHTGVQSAVKSADLRYRTGQISLPEACIELAQAVDRMSTVKQERDREGNGE